MKVNSDKSHLLISGNKETIANIVNNYIESENLHELLGIIIDSKVTFENHTNKVWKKAIQKLNSFARISNCIDFNKRKKIMKTFIASEFSYCPFVWMIHIKKQGKKINASHERALRITYGDKTSLFNELLEKSNSVSIHHKNLQALASKINKMNPIAYLLQLLKVFLYQRLSLTT